MFLDFGRIMKGEQERILPIMSQSANVKMSKVTEQFSRPREGWLGGRVETERKD